MKVIIRFFIAVFLTTLLQVESFACSMCKVTINGHTYLGNNEDSWRIGRRAWISGLGQRVGTEIGAHVDGIQVLPRDTALRFGKHEAVRHERPRVDVELAHDLGVSAALREMDQAPLVLRIEAARAVVDEALVLRLAEGIDIEKRGPRRLRFLVIGERGLAPETARVLGVGPEIPHALVLDAWRRNSLLRAVDREEAILERLEAGLAGELLLGDRVVGAREGERLLAVDLLEIEKVLVLDRRYGGGGLRSGRRRRRLRHRLRRHQLRACTGAPASAAGGSEEGERAERARWERGPGMESRHVARILRALP